VFLFHSCYLEANIAPMTDDVFAAWHSASVTPPVSDDIDALQIITLAGGSRNDRFNSRDTTPPTNIANSTMRDARMCHALRLYLIVLKHSHSRVKCRNRVGVEKVTEIGR
jgi:hypothetical protein